MWGRKGHFNKNICMPILQDNHMGLIALVKSARVGSGWFKNWVKQKLELVYKY